jgi:hypothetical protein
VSAFQTLVSQALRYTSDHEGTGVSVLLFCRPDAMGLIAVGGDVIVSALSQRICKTAPIG